MLPILLAAFVATAAHGCPQFSPEDQLPQAAAADTVVCQDGYAVGHSKTLRSPIWSAEVLTPDGAKAALAAKRFGAFHLEPLIPAADQSHDADFHCSTFDKGHMTPVGDFGTPPLENETFSMANMAVQDFRLNEGLWAGIENGVLKAAAAGHTFYIVTGPAFGPEPKLLAGRDAIPDATWKAEFDATTGAAGVYWAVNDGSGAYELITDAEAAARLRFDPLPGIPEAAKGVVGAIPQPTKGTPPGRPARACH